MHHFQIANGETIYGQIVDSYGKGYDRIFVVECEGVTYHIHQSQQIDWL